ncbi:peptide/nickel transport system substrate-binding protein [Paenibacillus sp. RC73]|uniref:ABC transporter substrate-binding protein n=1 Tax=Paenibacillus sp. RC73 TaxID=3156250 RepID=UPI0038368C34
MLKKGLSLIVVLSTLLWTAGCASNANSPSASSGEKGAEASAPPKAITLAYSEGGSTMDPAEASDLTSDTLVLALYDQLVTYGKKSTDSGEVADTEAIKPMLAEKWDVSADNMTYTMHLRKDVKFQSGNPLTANSVLYSLERLKNSDSGSFLYGMSSIKTATAPDEHTVVITLSQPNHMFLQILSLYNFSIVDDVLVKEKGDGEYLKTHAAGSGPFKLEKWDPATEAVFNANASYWQGAPNLSKVTMKFTKEASNRVLLLDKGDVDMAIEIPAKDVAKLETNADLKVQSNASNRILYFAMNNKVKPFNDPKVRQAISYAIPYDQLIDDVMYGQAKQMKSSVASNTPGYTDAGYSYKHDLNKAKQLLTEAGYPNGFNFDLTLGSGFQDWADDAVLIQAELAKIGVKMNVVNVARAQFLEQQREGNLTAYISKWTSFVNDPGYHLGFLMYSSGSSNYIHYANPEVDKLWEQAGKEQDENKRKELYGKAQELINQDSPWAYLYEYNRVVGMGKDVTGYVYYPDEVIRFYSLKKE